jgi:L-lactate dehydrogenase complex protein LldF
VRWIMASPRRFARAGRAARLGRLAVRHGRPMLPLPRLLRGWTASRDVPTPQGETFRDWWLRTHGENPR